MELIAGCSGACWSPRAGMGRRGLGAGSSEHGLEMLCSPLTAARGRDCSAWVRWALVKTRCRFRAGCRRRVYQRTVGLPKKTGRDVVNGSALVLCALFAGAMRGLGDAVCRYRAAAVAGAAFAPRAASGCRCVQLRWSWCLFVIRLFPFDLLLLLPFTINKSLCPVMSIPRSVSGASRCCPQPGFCKAQPLRWLRSCSHRTMSPQEWDF